MSLVCEFCGKSKSEGNSQTHRRGVAGKRWRKRAQVTPRTFFANLQLKTFTIDGVRKQMRVCTKCLKRIKKYGKIKGFSSVAL
ncbi:MAG: LSU ribosomal protein L28P [Microgenomates group bacterium GW2011_GWC1_37_12b]|nr:MAG: LSU ribosomal protein L28P [Microgenomates group bacterium GW2011_GWC1_37_12b]